MHEVELGVWKGLMTHLIRILRSENEHLVHELDRRFVVLSSVNLFLWYTKLMHYVGIVSFQLLDEIRYDALEQIRLI